jgi:hypothetical protein
MSVVTTATQVSTSDCAPTTCSHCHICPRWTGALSCTVTHPSTHASAVWSPRQWPPVVPRSGIASGRLRRRALPRGMGRLKMRCGIHKRGPKLAGGSARARCHLARMQGARCAGALAARQHNHRHMADHTFHGGRPVDEPGGAGAIRVGGEVALGRAMVPPIAALTRYLSTGFTLQA